MLIMVMVDFFIYVFKLETNITLLYINHFLIFIFYVNN